jgi:hypothetical protein
VAYDECLSNQTEWKHKGHLWDGARQTSSPTTVVMGEKIRHKYIRTASFCSCNCPPILFVQPQVFRRRVPHYIRYGSSVLISGRLLKLPKLLFYHLDSSLGSLFTKHHHHRINLTVLASHVLQLGMALEPPEKEEYTSLERAESVVCRHARLQGYALTRRNLIKDKRKPPTVRRRDLRCSKGGVKRGEGALH